MTFLWPQNLWILLVLAPLAGAYAWWAGRGRAAALSSAGLHLIEESLRSQGAGRHFPPLLMVLALAALLAAIARPSVVVALPTARPTLILAMDVSGSMQADDVAPTRLDAAKAAARDFARALPQGARIGIVQFSDGAWLTLPPTADREAVIAATETLQPQTGTAIGYGILASLQALFPRERFAIEEESASAGASVPPSSPDPGSAIVLLTDGQNTEGPAPGDAARLAAQRGVRIYTIGIGTPVGHISPGPAADVPVSIDEDSLKMIASLAGGEYFYASTAPDLERIYSDLGAKLVLAKDKVEITALFCAFGALVLVASALLSVLRHGRIA